MILLGKYVDDIRMLCEDLLCMGVSTRNVEDVIRNILKHTYNIDVGRRAALSILIEHQRKEEVSSLMT